MGYLILKVVQLWRADADLTVLGSKMKPQYFQGRVVWVTGASSGSKSLKQHNIGVDLLKTIAMIMYAYKSLAIAVSYSLFQSSLVPRLLFLRGGDGLLFPPAPPRRKRSLGTRLRLKQC